MSDWWTVYVSDLTASCLLFNTNCCYLLFFVDPELLLFRYLRLLFWKKKQGTVWTYKLWDNSINTTQQEVTTGHELKACRLSQRFNSVWLIKHWQVDYWTNQPLHADEKLHSALKHNQHRNHAAAWKYLSALWGSLSFLPSRAPSWFWFLCHPADTAERQRSSRKRNKSSHLKLLKDFHLA